MLLVMGTGETPRAAVTQIKLFKTQHPAGRIAVLADCWDLSDMLSVFRAGANACFAKLGTCDILIKSLELVMLGETILPSAMLLPLILEKNEPLIEPQIHASARDATHLDGNDTPLDGNDTPRLSTREKCVLRYLVEGNSNKLIARKIDVTEATVKVHVKAILRKVRVENRTQAAMWAINHGSFSSAIGSASFAELNAPTRLFPPARLEFCSVRKTSLAYEIGARSKGHFSATHLGAIWRTGHGPTWERSAACSQQPMHHSQGAA